jgi:hypothetical protein
MVYNNALMIEILYVAAMAVERPSMEQTPTGPGWMVFIQEFGEWGSAADSLLHALQEYI